MYDVTPYRNRLTMMIALWLVPWFAAPIAAQSRMSVKPTYHGNRIRVAQRSLNLPPVEPPSATMEANPRPPSSGATPVAEASPEELPLDSPFYFGELGIDGSSDSVMPYTLDDGAGNQPLLEATPMLDGWEFGIGMGRRCRSHLQHGHLVPPGSMDCGRGICLLDQRRPPPSGDRRRYQSDTGREQPL